MHPVFLHTLEQSHGGVLNAPGFIAKLKTVCKPLNILARIWQ
jgi:hypothetical protein